MSDIVKEKNLAYGGQALIEGILMRGQEAYAYTIKQPDGLFYKQKNDYLAIGKRIKFFGLPFIRGVAGLFENMILSIKILNKSAEIAFPEEEMKKKDETLFTKIMNVLFFAITIFFTFLIFVILPYISTNLFPVNQNDNPILFNLIAGLIRLLLFFGYIIAISFTKDVKRLFGYHGAEHKTINAYESKEQLTVENVNKHSRLHPRCGTSFVFIVFFITLIVFPLFNMFFNTQSWYNALLNYGKIGKIAQSLVHVFSHIFIGMPIVSAISYELLKLSAKYKNNFFVKIFISPGMFWQLFTTKEPDNDMIKAGILSLKMVLGEEKADTIRSINDNINFGNALNIGLMTKIFLLPINFIKNFF